MKKILCIIILSIITFSSCNKDNSNPVNTNTAPATPILISPTDSATGVSVSTTFSWKTIANADSFSLQVSLSNSFENYVFNKSGLTGTSKQVTGLNYLTLYYWRVNATNKYGTSNWSNTNSFITTGTLPEVPVLFSPVTGTTNVSTMATLNWYASSEATSYTLQLSKNSLFTSLEYDQSGLTGTSQQVNKLNNLTLYYWRVSASNNYGTSGWSNTNSFTTIGSPPEIPVVLSPANGSINVTTPPTLSWNASTNAISYSLQISKDSSFTILEYNQSVITGTNKQVPGLIKYTLYYWRVSATNFYGTSQYSNIWNFTTSTATPCPGTPTVTYAGKIYNTVQIVDQCWLKENLDVGIMIEANIKQKDNGLIEKYCYNNDTANCSIYGGLYQWDEAMQYVTTEGTQGICPVGWHLPSKQDLTLLFINVNFSGNSLKEIGQGWGSGAGNNKSGFSALLSGCGTVNNYFSELGYITWFWSSNLGSATGTSYSMYLKFDVNIILDNNYGKDSGFSIRCIKD